MQSSEVNQQGKTSETHDPLTVWRDGFDFGLDHVEARGWAEVLTCLYMNREELLVPLPFTV